MGRTFRLPLAMAAAALLTAPFLTGSALTGTATAAETGTTAAVTAEAAGDPVYARLYNQGTGKCLAVPDEFIDVKNTKMIQWTCSTSESQYWTLAPVTGGYQVKNLASGMCLAMASSTKVHGANPIQWPCDGGDGGEQVWAQDANDRLKNFNSEFCLAILDSSTVNGVNAAQWTCGENEDQQWLW